MGDNEKNLTLVVTGADKVSPMFAQVGKNIEQTFAKGLLDADLFGKNLIESQQKAWADVVKSAKRGMEEIKTSFHPSQIKFDDWGTAQAEKAMSSQMRSSIEKVAMTAAMAARTGRTVGHANAYAESIFSFEEHGKSQAAALWAAMEARDRRLSVAEEMNPLTRRELLLEQNNAFRATGRGRGGGGGGYGGGGGGFGGGGGDGGDQTEIQQLRGAFGRFSSFAQLVGGGAFLGLDVLGRELGNFAESAAKINKEFSEGKTDVLGMATAIGEGLPLLGGWVTAGQQIREAFLGEKAAIEAINEEAKQGEQFVIAMHAAEMGRVRERIDGARKLRDILQQSAMIGMTGGAPEIFGARFRKENLIADTPADLLRVRQEAGRKTAEEMAGINADLPRQIELQKHAHNMHLFRMVLGFGQDPLDPTGSVDAKSDRVQATTSQIGKLSKERTAEQAEAEKRFNEQRQAEIVAAGKAEEEAMRRDREQERLRRRDEQEQVAVTRAEFGREAARRSGTLPEFEAKQADIDFERKSGRIGTDWFKRLDDLKRSGGASPEYNQQITKDANERIDLAKHEADMRKLAAGEQGVLAEEQAILIIRREQLTAMDQEIEAGNKLRENERARMEISERFDRRKRDLMEAYKTAPADQKAAMQALITGIPAEEQAAQAAHSNRTLTNLGRSMLESEAGAGIGAAGRALKKFDIQEKYRQLKEQLTGMGPAGAGMLGDLGGLEQRELAMAARSGIQFSGTAGTSENRFGRSRGFGLYAKEDAMLRTHNAGQDLVKIAQHISDVLNKLSAIIHQDSTLGGQPILH